MQKVKAEKETSTLQSGAQRVGVRWKPDASAEAEWTPEPQVEGYIKGICVDSDGEGTVIEAQGIEVKQLVTSVPEKRWPYYIYLPSG